MFLCTHCTPVFNLYSQLFSLYRTAGPIARKKEERAARNQYLGVAYFEKFPSTESTIRDIGWFLLQYPGIDDRYGISIGNTIDVLANFQSIPILSSILRQDPWNDIKLIEDDIRAYDSTILLSKFNTVLVSTKRSS